MNGFVLLALAAVVAGSYGLDLASVQTGRESYCSKTLSSGSIWQANLKNPLLVSGIKAADAGVQTYKVSISADGKVWKDLEDLGTLSGDSSFDPILASGIRIQVLTSEKDLKKCATLKIVGCDKDTNLNPTTTAAPEATDKPCDDTGKGVGYMGDLAVTENNKGCITWTETNTMITTPLADNLFPDGSAQAAGARCRNPGGIYERPWCYQTNYQYGYCNIGKCGEEDPSLDAHKVDHTKCLETVRGKFYIGSKAETEDGEECMNWADVDWYSMEDSSFPDGSKAAAKNYCRNPGGIFNKPLCFTVSRGFGYCDIPMCA